MPNAWLCDFDGTISPADIGAALLDRFGAGDRGGLAGLLARWSRGEIGHRELTLAECARMRVEEQEARAYARTFPLDPGFAPFAAGVRRRGDVVMVVSEGFDFYVAEHLERAGLADLPWAANHATFADGRLIPEFPWSGGCGRCGNCKAQHAGHWRERGYRVVAVGDGLSDRCAARASDAVMARGGLLDWCRERGIPAEPFRDFGELARRAARPVAGSALGR